jgi:hypothetical protein
MRVLQATVRRITGISRQYIDGAPIADTAMVQIIPREGGDAVFLVRFDAEGRRMTDSWYPSLEKGKRAAQLEFEIGPDDWVATDVSTSFP